MLRFLFVTILFFASGFSSEILLKDYDRVAIASDLEPDDVMALKILFQEANRIYADTAQYPIGFVLVGEGNSQIKRQRMERMLQEFFQIPKGVKIKVEAGKSTQDNLFPFDGEELFEKSELAPFVENSGIEGSQALEEFVKGAKAPLIIQLKPTQELLNLSLEQAQKTTVLFYGSFNFRKTIVDQDVRESALFVTAENDQQRLQRLLDHFSNAFLKVGIVESYGMLGEESSIYREYPWTDSIAQSIEKASDPFSEMFKKLVANWNLYLLQAELPEIRQKLVNLQQTALKTWMYYYYLSEWGQITAQKIAVEQAERAATCERLIAQVDALTLEWNEELFTDIYESGMTLSDELLQRSLKFANQLKPSSGIQFTLSDIAVALAASDQSGFFTASPSRIVVNERGYLTAFVDKSSRVFYYNRVDHERFAQILLQALDPDCYLLMEQI